MHQNLLTSFSLDNQNNDLKTLKGFQQLRSDSAYMTFFTIYAKFSGDVGKDKTKIDQAVFFLQNFSGMVNVGFENVHHEVDIIFDTDINEPIYFLNIECRALSDEVFYPKQKEGIISDDETLNGNFETISLKIKEKPTILKLKKDIVAIAMGTPSRINEVVEEIEANSSTYVDHQNYFNHNLKFYVNIHYKDLNKNSDGSFKKGVFLDSEYYQRFGDEIHLKETRNIKKEPDKPADLSLFGARVNLAEGIVYNDKCHPSYVKLKNE